MADIAPPRRMSSEDARDKVVECVELAAHARDTSHKIMLQHMAETWERIARDIDQTKGN
jgi:hypothetical protein